MEGISLPDNKNESSPKSRQNVSFKFSKQTSRTLAKKLPGEKDSGQTSKDLVFSIEGKEIKSSIPKEKKKALVIAPIHKNVWRLPDQTDNNRKEEDGKKPSVDKLINDLAVKELLQETALENEKWEKREFENPSLPIPLVVQNKIPEGFETDTSLNVELRPAESSLEDYENIPIDEFGSAILRGLGCHPGDPVGNRNKKFVKPVEAVQRSKGLGLGADKRPVKTSVNPQAKDEVKLVAGAYVQIVQGHHQGCYGQVEGLDESRVIVLLGKGNKNVSLPLLYVEVISKKEYDKESKVINKRSYEMYKKEQELRNGFDSRNEHPKSSEQLEMANVRDECSSSKERRQGSSHSSSSKKSSHHSDEDGYSSKHNKRRKHSRERSQSKERHSTRDIKPNWVCPQLRVRLIDEQYKSGKYFNQKVIVEDVLSPQLVVCRTESKKYLEDISPTMLETVVPRSESSYVMIVEGKYKGQLGCILKRDKNTCIATIQFLSDREKVKKFAYDSICEYVGDISQFD